MPDGFASLLPPRLEGRLFPRFFLEKGLAGTPEWAALGDAAVDAFAAAVRPRFAGMEAHAGPNEAETEAGLIFPVLAALGWHDLRQQRAGAGRRDVPDALLFADAAARAAATRAKAGTPARHVQAAVVLENKSWGRPLDRAGSDGRTPASQILHYLRRAEELSDGAVRWGLLTNGRLWRLYTERVDNRAERFLEADLAHILASGAPEARDALRGFLLLFRPEAHRPDGAGLSFLERALAAGRRYESRITGALSGAVFDTVFPELVRAVAEGDPEAAPADAGWRREAREAALVLLYRCLFVLYAEDRQLLPVEHRGYRALAFRALREDAEKHRDGTLALRPRGTVWWERVRSLFDAIDKGDADLGLPPYNGGLFKDTPMLGRLRLRDGALAALIEGLSREGPPGARHWINYHDLSVQHLGTIYERLLEQEVALNGETGAVALRPNAFARKTSGSYYTPQELVALIIRRAVDPLLAERLAAFHEKAAALKSDRRPVAERLRELAGRDPAEAFLGLRVCDPAMGSGHFLVSLVDHLADATLRAMAGATAAVDWGEYVSPLAGRVQAMRDTIKARAKAGGWEAPDARLDDKALVRRVLLKRCVFGVDLNPMAVELAKLSLWLHSFTVGAPLSFLDHHLRCGDALFGEFVSPVVQDLSARYQLAMSQAVVRASLSAGKMAEIEALADAEISEVEASAGAFATLEDTTADLRAFLDLYHAGQWLPAAGAAAKEARDLLFGGSYGDPVGIAAGKASPAPPKDPTTEIRRKKRLVATTGEAHAEALAFLGSAGTLRLERRFLHWETAFPGVWENWQSLRPSGGFDAVIGNPPWDRMKLQEVEWFAARVPAVARSARAADRKRAIAALREDGDPVLPAYERAAWTAEAAARVARDCGAYPLLGGGDVNLYSLFVERALRLVRPGGMVGLLVPSGIAADKGAAEFFRSVATTGRLAAFFDFENRRTALDLEPFFPDVDTRFKFAALAVGGTARRFAKAAFAFFQQDAMAAERTAYGLTPRAIARLNPNTGTAPVFRTRRDAALTLAVHRRLPVLVRHEPKRAAVWPVRYSTMLHMTNDSGKFRTEAELVAAGAYRVAPARWRRGTDEWAPLLVGRSIHQFDHRFAAVTENAENLHNPFAGVGTMPLQHADPAYMPPPRFWVGKADVALPASLEWALGFRDITNPTNARTTIAAIVPFAGYGNTLPLLLPAPVLGPALPTTESHARWRQREARALRAYAAWAPLLLGNLNALVFDYVARQKMQGTHLNFYILEQLPVVPRARYGMLIGGRRARDLVRDHVLRLSYTARDLAAFAASQGHDGPPFRWDEEERLHLRARLDAIFFLLYGLDRDAAGHVLGTFPIVEREEKARHAGRFRSRDLILGYMAAFAAGDAESRVEA